MADQVASIEQILLSTKPPSRPMRWAAMSERSVGTLDAFFGQQSGQSEHTEAVSGAAQQFAASHIESPQFTKRNSLELSSARAN